MAGAPRRTSGRNRISSARCRPSAAGSRSSSRSSDRRNAEHRDVRRVGPLVLPVPRLLLLASATAAAVAALAASTPAPARRPIAPGDLAPAIRALVGDSAQTTSLILHLDSAATVSARRIAAASGAEPDAARAAILREIGANLDAKRAAGFPLDAPSLRRTVVDYECWKAETFVGAGVF